MQTSRIPSSDRRTSGFTLVELLVTIAVIAVLASLVIAGIGRARTSADSAKCVNNLRAIYTAMTLHAQDNDLIIIYNQMQYGTTWVNTLRPYTGLKAYGSGAEQTPIANAVGKRPDSVWACPASKRTVTTNENTWSDYGSNWCINPSFSSAGSGGFFSPIYKIPMIDKPGQVIFAGDADQQRGIHPWGMPLAFRHGGRANVVYYDGHAASLKSSEVPTDGNKPPWRPATN